MNDQAPHRYKIFEIHQTTQLSGSVRIVSSEDDIATFLLAEIKRVSPAEGVGAFGILTETFAWYWHREHYHLILSQADGFFNIDVIQIARQQVPGLPPVSYLSPLLNRIPAYVPPVALPPPYDQCRRRSPGSAMPCAGIGGSLWVGPPKDQEVVWHVSELPSLEAGDAKAHEDLIDQWFHQVRRSLDHLKKTMPASCRLKVAFQGGGTIPIPQWFRDWCEQEGIEILVLDPVAPEARQPEPSGEPG
jgi:hypothetical protein